VAKTGVVVISLYTVYKEKKSMNSASLIVKFLIYEKNTKQFSPYKWASYLIYYKDNSTWHNYYYYIMTILRANLSRFILFKLKG
jgi:hypothetical protein